MCHHSAHFTRKPVVDVAPRTRCMVARIYEERVLTLFGNFDNLISTRNAFHVTKPSWTSERGAIYYYENTEFLTVRGQFCDMREIKNIKHEKRKKKKEKTENSTFGNDTIGIIKCHSEVRSVKMGTLKTILTLVLSNQSKSVKNSFLVPHCSTCLPVSVRVGFHFPRVCVIATTPVPSNP